jgi:hypothetical protein
MDDPDEAGRKVATASSSRKLLLARKIAAAWTVWTQISLLLEKKEKSGKGGVAVERKGGREK